MSSYTADDAVTGTGIHTTEIDFSEWKYVAGEGDAYIINKNGDVMSCYLRYRRGDEKKGDYWHPLKKFMSLGYFTVGMSGPKGKRPVRVHRLIALAFIPNPENKPQVNHKNGIKTDNSLENLEWVTVAENLTHACRVLRKRIGENHCFSKLTLEDVEHIRTLPAFGASQTKLGKMFGVSQSTIREILNREIWAT